MKAQESRPNGHPARPSGAGRAASEPDAAHPGEPAPAQASGAAAEDEYEDDEPGASAPLASAIGHIGQILAGMQTLLALRMERRRLAARRAVVLAIAGLLAAVALLPLIFTGATLLAAGIAQGYAVLFGDRVWLGNLIAGVTILGGVALLVWAGASLVAHKDLARKVAKHGDVPDEDATRTPHEAREPGARTAG